MSRLFAAERLKLLRNIIREQKSVEVSKLSQLLNVSEVTIRRDLDVLESEKLIERTHGGAILKVSENDLTESVTEDGLNSDIKEIADMAAHLVEENDIIMLINGKISCQMASILVNMKRLTVLTNDFNIASKLSGNTSIRVVMLGGDLLYDNNSVYGPLTLSNINSFNFNKLFIEIDGVNQDLHFTVESSEKAALISQAMQNSAQNILICVGDAFDHPSFFKIGGLEIAHKLVTNPHISDDYKREIFKQNIPLYTSMNIYEGGD